MVLTEKFGLKKVDVIKKCFDEIPEFELTKETQDLDEKYCRAVVKIAKQYTTS